MQKKLLQQARYPIINGMCLFACQMKDSCKLLLCGIAANPKRHVRKE